MGFQTITIIHARKDHASKYQSQSLEVQWKPAARGCGKADMLAYAINVPRTMLPDNNVPFPPSPSLQHPSSTLCCYISSHNPSRAGLFFAHHVLAFKKGATPNHNLSCGSTNDTYNRTGCVYHELTIQPLVRPASIRQTVLRV